MPVKCPRLSVMIFHHDISPYLGVASLKVNLTTNKR